MANKFGSRYESQFRQPRQSGWKQTSAMENLMQIMQIGGDIAQNVQENRNRRQSFDLKMIDLYAGDFQNEFSNERLSESIKQLEEYSIKNQNRFSADTTQALQAIKTKMQTQFKANDAFSQDRLRLEGISGGADALLDDLYAWDSLTPDKQALKIFEGQKDSAGTVYTDNYSNKKREDLTSMIEEYGKLKTDLGLHDERRMNNAFWMKLGDTERALNGMLSIAKSENRITEKEYNVFGNVLETGWTQEAEDFVGMQRKAMTNAQASVFNELEGQRGLLESTLKVLDSGTTQLAIKDIPYELKLSEDGITLKDEFHDPSGTAVYDVNLNDGSKIATYYKDQMIENIVKHKDEIEGKTKDYLGQVGLNYIRMKELDKEEGVLDRADAHISGFGSNVKGYLGKGEESDTVKALDGLKDRYDAGELDLEQYMGERDVILGKEGREGESPGLTSNLVGVSKDYTDYTSNIVDLKSGARASVEPIIKRRTDDLNNYINLTDSIKIGEGAVYGAKAQKEFAEKNNLKVEDVKEISKFYREKFPKSPDASHQWVIDESMRGLRQILEVEKGEDGRFDKNSYQYISKEPLSFEELTQIQGIFKRDKEEYDVVAKNKKILEDAGETKTQEYVALLKKEALFFQKWMGGSPGRSADVRSKEQASYIDPFTGELAKAEGDYFGVGVWGSGNPGKIKGMADALNASLSFYNDFLPSQANKKSEKLGKIITQSSTGGTVDSNKKKDDKKQEKLYAQETAVPISFR